MAAAGVPVEMTFVKYVGSMEPSELCMLIGTCLDTAAARMGIAQPLKPNSAVALSQMMVLAQALQAVPAAPANDHCETCKVMLAPAMQLTFVVHGGCFAQHDCFVATNLPLQPF
jgi:hypothetical protein